MIHSVEMKTDCVHIKKGGITLAIRQGGRTFGTLVVTMGGVAWYPKNAKKPSKKKSWEEFNEIMTKGV